MSHPRFYIDPEAWNGDALVLTADEAHHCADVLRCKAGDKVLAFDGRGTEASAEIEEIARHRVTLRRLTVSKTAPPPARLTLGQAIPKGKNMDLIIQKGTELGAHEIAPILSERTVVRLDPDERARKQAKWERVALEASKQSGQNWLPAVPEPQPLDRFLQRYAAENAGTNGLMLIASLQPDAAPLKDLLHEHLELNGNEKPDRALVLIGPEGDFTPAEIGQARSAGCLPFTLGPIVLRTETAAIYAMSVLGHELF